MYIISKYLAIYAILHVYLTKTYKSSYFIAISNCYTATVADECTVLGVSCNPKSFGKSLAASDEVQPKEDLQTLKILSYNVWFAEDIELRIRMRAIGDIIQLHNPDVICLQEVTPDIYAILQRSNWWKSYKCSLSFDTANTRPYFCMQVSFVHITLS
ncbi:putative endonuclease/exonuclease/phosphatase [Helianthus annuus]|nr:putative endonuclease/exonuclease/phosphatase [Helianthus annuus]KAJ0647678.1 putative endonuclease/exonuclease/phosphatase [Helianthus annuus]